MEQAAKSYFGSEADCYKKKFAVIIPSFRAQGESGCPGSREPCPAKKLPKKQQADLCREGARDVMKAMADIFGSGNTVIRTIGSWYNSDTKKFERERGLKVETRFKNSCLTKGSSSELVRRVDDAMSKTCQSQWFFETEKEAYLVNTGKKRR